MIDIKKNKYLQYITGIVIIITLAAYIRITFSPISSINQIHKNTSEQDLYDSTLTDNCDSAVARLVAEKAFLNAQLSLTGYDSIYMILNLADTSLQLMLQGVSLQKTKISNLKYDGFLHKYSLNDYQYVFSKPLKISQQYASIVKEPIVNLKAPKTPEEAAENQHMPDTLIQRPAHVFLRAGHHLQITITQDEKAKGWDNASLLFFRTKFIINRMNGKIKELLFLSPLIYKPSICFKMPASELRSVYRALPSEPLLLITYKMH